MLKRKVKRSYALGFHTVVGGFKKSKYTSIYTHIYIDAVTFTEWNTVQSAPQ